MDLFGRQEQLAKAQSTIERMDEEIGGRAAARAAAEQALAELKEQASDQQAVLNREHQQVCTSRQGCCLWGPEACCSLWASGLQPQVMGCLQADHLAQRVHFMTATLRQVEAHDEQMKKDIAVVRRSGPFMPM